MKKALIVASIGDFLPFEKSDILLLQQLGYEVDCAANFNYYKGQLDDFDVNKIQIPFERSPINIRNFKALKELKKIINDNEYTLVHCHTPVGGVLARLAAKKKRKNGELKVIYTAHGFHFFKGAPIKNWLLFYPIEKWLSKYTDILITINKEDYERANKKFHAKRTEYIPGVGVDLKKFNVKDFDKNSYREKLGVKKEDFFILSVGEVNKNKNHEVIIKAISLLGNEQVHYFIAGDGPLKDYLIDLANKLNIQNQIHLLGYRYDIPELNLCADLFAFPSKREGLGLAAIESMSCGTPIIGSNVHGINDYLLDGITGYSFPFSDVNGFSKGIEKMIKMKECDNGAFGISAKEMADKFSVHHVREKMNKIYRSI